MNQNASLLIIPDFRCAAIIATIVTMTIASAWQPSQCAQIESLPPINLTIVAPNGTGLVLNSTDIGSLPSYRAYGGYKNQLGNIRGLGNYTGVPLPMLCNLVGGINSSQCLLVTASDDYSMTFTYAQVNGDFVTYDPATGDEVQHLEPLTAILAYYKNDLNLSLDDGGPLRLAIVGPEGFATNSTYWVKWIIRLEILRYDDVAVTAVTPSKTVLDKTCVCNISVTVENLGSYSESFNFTLYANTTAIGTVVNVVLANKTSRTLSFLWNTTSSAYGKYTIKAEATTVPYEINTANNTHGGGTVTVTITGDVDGNSVVNILDVVKITGIYGAKRGQPRFESNSDLDDNGVINILDVVKCTGHYGDKYP
jgi:Oxidoreductase molybdopterin binding domain/CARDB